jgi:hypothetical protein
VKAKRVTLVMVALLLTAGACTDPPTGSPTPSPTPSPSVESGIVLRGWPTEAFECSRPGQRSPKADPVPFDTVTELLVCTPGKTTGASVLGTDPNFETVMKELSAKDMRGIYFCPMMPRDGRETTLIVLASTPDQDYRVRLPAGVCGSLQQNLSQALTEAGIRVPGRTTTY